MHIRNLYGQQQADPRWGDDGGRRGDGETDQDNVLGPGLLEIGLDALLNLIPVSDYHLPAVELGLQLIGSWRCAEAARRRAGRGQGVDRRDQWQNSGAEGRSLSNAQRLCNLALM